MTHLTTNQYLDVPPRMVLDIAYGIDEPSEIAAKYGFSDDQWLELKAHAPFVKLVEDKKAELKADGYSFRVKCSWMAEDLLEDLYRRAKDKDVSFSALLESIKFTAKASALDAPPKEEANTGSTFSININLGQGKSVSVNVAQGQNNISDVIDVEPEEDTYDIDLGEIPWHLRSARSELQLEVE